MTPKFQPIFRDDDSAFPRSESKKFRPWTTDKIEDICELSISLDIINTFTNDNELFNYLNVLFNCSSKFVVIYTADNENDNKDHLCKTKCYVDDTFPNWNLINILEKKIPISNKASILVTFLIYEKK